MHASRGCHSTFSHPPTPTPTAALYPKIRIDSLVVRGSYFSPPVVEYVSVALGVRPNMCFIAMPGASFPYAFASRKGVRLVTTGGGEAQRVEAARHMLVVLGKGD